MTSSDYAVVIEIKYSKNENIRFTDSKGYITMRKKSYTLCTSINYDSNVIIHLYDGLTWLIGYKRHITMLGTIVLTE